MQGCLVLLSTPRGSPAKPVQLCLCQTGVTGFWAGAGRICAMGEASVPFPCAETSGLTSLGGGFFWPKLGQGAVPGGAACGGGHAGTEASPGGIPALKGAFWKRPWEGRIWQTEGRSSAAAAPLLHNAQPFDGNTRGGEGPTPGEAGSEEER